MKYHLFLILVVTSIGFSYSQSFNFKQYTVGDGLPSSEVYSAFQDSKGYMWFATDAGVSRFNGYEFQNFDTGDGLVDNTIFLISEDNKGRIWFGSFSCQLAYFEEGEIFPYKYNHVLKDSINGVHVLCSFDVDDDGTIWLGFNHSGFKKIDSKGKFHNFSSNDDGPNSFYVLKKPDNVHYGFMYSKLNKSGVTLDYKNEHSGIHRKLTIMSPEEVLNNYHRTSIVLLKDLIIFQTFSSGIFTYNETSNKFGQVSLPVELADKNIFSMFHDDGLLYLCTDNYGIYQCRITSDSLIVINQFLDGTEVSRIYKDNEGGYWIMSIQNGIYYCPSLLINNDDFASIITEKNRVNRLSVDPYGNLFVGHETGLFRSNSRTGIVESLAAIPDGAYVTISYDPKLKQTVFGSGGEFYYYKSKFEHKLKTNDKYAAKFILADSNMIYLAHSDGFNVLKDGEEIFDNRNLNHTKKYYTCLFKNGDETWIGCNEGINIYHNRQITAPFTSNKYLSSAVTSMARLDERTVLVGTKKYGVLLVRNKKVVDVLDQDDGLVGNLVRTLYVDEEKTIWAGTTKGLSRISYNESGVCTVHNITDKHGLASMEIMDITSQGNIIYVATVKGLCHFDKTEVRINRKSPPVYLTQFNVNSRERALTKSPILSYKENYIQISFEALSYRSGGDVEYQYRMLGVNSEWISTKVRYVQYPTLQPNTYSFQVRAKNEDGVWSNTSTLVTFTIEPPFWLTWWFTVLMILSGIVFVYLVFRLRLKQLKSKSEIKSKIAEADKRAVQQELMTLRAQMNPHFIFNTLSAIRSAINTSDKEVASNYVVSFGKLIRMVLETSKNPTIEVGMEIEMLTLYLELEAMRFSDKFAFEITLDQELSVDSFYIPAMVIQPFVENAILHGLVPKESENLRLSINFSSPDQNHIVCIIQDNGIGRVDSEKLNKLKKLNKQSMGMQITKDRLDLFYKESGKQYSFEVIDLMDQNKESAGTKVKIIFPL